MRSYTYLIINSPQTLLRNLNLVRTSFKVADRGRINFVFIFARADHGLFSEELPANPLQRNPLRWDITSFSEIVTPLDLKLKAIHHVAGGVHADTKVRVLVRADPVRPVVFEGGAVID